MNIELPHLELTQLLIFTLIVTAVDVIGAYVLAATQGKFDLSYVAGWVQTHTVKRIFPIAALAILGNGIAAANLPRIDVVYLGAEAALLVYLLETVQSVRVNFQDASAVKDETPVPPTVPPTAV